MNTKSLHQKVSIAIKTFERPEALRTMLISMRSTYPNIPILVADDGKDAMGGRLGEHSIRHWQKTYGVRWYGMPFDSGLSAGRNLLMQHIETPYVVLMDDDFVLEQSDLLERFVEELEYWPYDIVAGKLLRTDGREQHYEGWMVRDGDTLLLLRIESEEQTIPVEIVLNFFIARVDVLRKVPWDAAQKIIEHEDFFWRCKQAGVSVGYCPRLSMVHPEGAGDPFYKRHRNARVVHFREQVFAKHGWKDIVWRAL